jgi:phosphatidylinositol 4-kinase type 2
MMGKSRPATSGYAKIAQAEEEDDDSLHSDEDIHQGQSRISTDADSTTYAPIQSRRRERMDMPEDQPSNHRRRRTNSGVDIKAINARLEKWADEIAQKLKIRKVKGKSQEEEQLEIHHSVFQAPDWIRPATAETLDNAMDEPSGDRISKFEFDEIVESVRVAIELGIQPTLISQGSSGSYFARNTSGKIVGVFKPKDEEPYASKNPKWTKWIHRNLFPFFFGRACLIPNLSYISEAAAYVLDNRLRTHIVPYTDVVTLSSKSFFYDFWDRRAHYRKGKPFPEKQGSLQVFLKGFKDANIFLKEHPWPDQHNSGFRTDAAPKRKRRIWGDDCRPRGAPSDDEDDDGGEPQAQYRDHQRSRKVFWTPALQQSLREQLEKLVILDYIMRNTDRGLDNWMIRIDQQTQEATIVVEPPKKSTNGEADPYKRQETMTTDDRAGSRSSASVTLGAIDNSLSWPWKHPDAWRSFPFGWLFLPVSLIGRPFSEKTKQHFLPLLTSKQWWSETQIALRNCFEQDADFQEKMFARQMAVMKGQAWNVVETLKTPDHGPLELTRRARVCVWDDVVEIPVAVPLRASSNDVRRKPANIAQGPGIREEEEMDISAAHASAPPLQTDLLGLDLPHNNRFNTSRQEGSGDARRSDDSNGPLSPSSVKDFTFDTAKESRSVRPVARRTKSRLSLDETRRLFDNLGERRGFPFGSSKGNDVEDDAELDGDLGFAAAEDQEGYRRKVIVERIEMVKGRAPVFTWC